MRKFAQAHGFDFPVIDDSNADISSLMRIPGPLVILGADAEGYMNFALPGFDTEQENAADVIADRLRDSLRISSEVAEAGPLLSYPQAPSFETPYIGGPPFHFLSLIHL